MIEIGFKRIDWWFWAITLAFIIAALLGCPYGYHAVIGISLLQVIYYGLSQKSFLSFDSQVRVIYFAMTLVGFSEALKFPGYFLLMLGTLMVVLFDRCGIALVLKKMPWNKQQLVRVIK